MSPAIYASRGPYTGSDRTVAGSEHPVAPPSESSVASLSPVVSDPEKGAPLTNKEVEETSPAEAETANPGLKADPYLVVLEGKDDPLNPQNWPTSKKYIHTLIYAFSTFVVTFASSAFSSGTNSIMAEFGMSTAVATLGTSLFVLGFAFGPQIWGPMSELYGRKTPLLIGYISFAIFAIPVATAQNIQTIMLGRFFGGLCGSAPLAIVAGAMTDFWQPEKRATAIGFFALATFGGPALGPIIGAVLAQTGSYGWRWIEWFILCFGMSMASVVLLFVDESYVPILLQRKAKSLRFSTQEWAYHSHLDTICVDFKDLVTKYLLRPMKMLVLEPMLMAMTIYLAFVYGLLYLLFSAVPIVFEIHRQLKPVPASLPFLSVFIGVCFAVATIIIFSPRYARKMAANGGKIVPEERLVPMFFGAIAFPIGLFWFAWTSSPEQVSSPWLAIVALGFVGYGILLIFLQGLNFIVDVYLFVANSAVAGNTLLRSFVGCGFPLFAAPFYDNLGVQWATSTLAFIALALAPIPFAFHQWGPALRRMSKFAP